MNSEFENAIIATDKKAQYDKCAKRLLGEKYILAYILTKTVEHIEEDLNIMCNLSEAIEERGIAKGVEQEETNIILNM